MRESAASFQFHLLQAAWQQGPRQFLRAASARFLSLGSHSTAPFRSRICGRERFPEAHVPHSGTTVIPSAIGGLTESKSYRREFETENVV